MEDLLLVMLGYTAVIVGAVLLDVLKKAYKKAKMELLRQKVPKELLDRLENDLIAQGKALDIEAELSKINEIVAKSGGKHLTKKQLEAVFNGIKVGVPNRDRKRRLNSKK